MVLATVALHAGPALGMRVALAQGTVPPATQSIERLAPTNPPSAAPPLQQPPPQAARGPGEGQEVAIGRVRLGGNEALDEARLRPLVAGLEGRRVRLAEIEEGRLGLLMAYREAGYLFTAVTASLQPEADGASLLFTVTEAQIAEVRLEGDIGPAGTQVLRFLQRLVGQPLLRGADIERALLLASDIPGVSVNGVLRALPGEANALQLVAQVSRKPFSGYLTVDNRGYDLAGPWQGIASFSANSFTALGEQTELLLYGTEGARQYFMQAGTEAFIGGSGLKVRLYAGGGRAEPGSFLAAIGYQGDTRVAGAALSYPVLRTRPASLWVSGGLDLFESEVRQGTIGPKPRASFDSTRVLRLGAEATLLDELLPFLPPATNQFLLRLSHGLESLGATRKDSPLVARDGSDFGFRKVVAEWTRRQPVAVLPWETALSLQGSAVVQWSDSVLPPSEKFYFGGNRLGRGYYAGQVTGDRAALYALELQFDRSFEYTDRLLGAVTLASQLYLFRDYGRTFENNEDPARRVSSYGVGLRLVANDRVQWDVEAARRIARRVDAAGSNVAPLDGNEVFTRLLLRF